MKVYEMPLTIDNTDIQSCYIFTDNVWSGSEAVRYEDVGAYSLRDADYILNTLDDMFGSSYWRTATQGRYNRVNSTFMLEYVSALIEQYWAGKTNFKALETVYTTDTVIANDMDLDSTTFTSDTTATNTGSVIVGTDSPIRYSIIVASDALTFSFPVFPENAVVNGKFNMTTDMKYNSVSMTIYMPTHGDWYIQCYTSGLQYSVPQSWCDVLDGKDANPANTDPYSGGGGQSSEPGGGGGAGNSDNYDPTSDPNPIPNLPTVTAIDTGFITLYNPTIYELKQLATYMWAGAFDVDAFKKIMADPMDTIIGLSLVPVNVPSGGSRAITVGNISTGISMTTASAQYVALDCGSIAINEQWHSYLDYSPYTKISIFLPYIGDHPIDIDLFQGTNMGVVYHIDVLSGACVAFITANNRVVYQFSGQCAVSIPVTSKDLTQTIMNLCQLVAGGVGVVATGGMSAPVTASMIAGGATALANTANNVVASKPRFAKSGSLSGSNGLMGTQKPYLIAERPKLCAPASQNAYTGYPSYVTAKLSSLSGFTQIQDIHLENIACTETERAEILNSLRGGVIL